jgi:hypothetical protein
LFNEINLIFGIGHELFDGPNFRKLLRMQQIIALSNIFDTKSMRSLEETLTFEELLEFACLVKILLVVLSYKFKVLIDNIGELV